MKIIGTFLTLLLIAGTRANLVPGDDAFLRMDYPTAIEAYEKELALDANDPEVLWRLARVYVCAGEVKSYDEAESDFRKAASYARACLRNDSTCSAGHTWLAAALGYLALEAPLHEKLRLTAEMSEEIDKAIAFDPHNDAAYSMRGSFYRALGNAGWLERKLAVLLFGSVFDGGYEEAEAALKKAIELAPGVMRHPYELGILYLDWGRKDEARAMLERAAQLPLRVAIDVPRREKIRMLLSQLAAEER
ncbi:MAG: hypothetical protein C4326_05845 [Ignavibacteria bacterium]